jgi:hypothetical protein
VGTGRRKALSKAALRRSSACFGSFRALQRLAHRHSFRAEPPVIRSNFSSSSLSLWITQSSTARLRRSKSSRAWVERSAHEFEYRWGVMIDKAKYHWNLLAAFLFSGILIAGEGKSDKLPWLFAQAVLVRAIWLMRCTPPWWHISSAVASFAAGPVRDNPWLNVRHFSNEVRACSGWQCCNGKSGPICIDPR